MCPLHGDLVVPSREARLVSLRCQAELLSSSLDLVVAGRGKEELDLES